jgi:putative hemolysin
MEDIVEEIFGEIEDEHDKEETTEKVIGDKEFEFSARLEIDYLNEKYGFNLPADDEQYDTLGGLILFLFGDIPEEQEIILHENFKFIPIRVSETKIELVKVILSK